MAHPAGVGSAAPADASPARARATPFVGIAASGDTGDFVAVLGRFLPNLDAGGSDAAGVLFSGMPRMSARKVKPAQPGGALCHCGRPLGHTGRHVGSSPQRRDAPRSSKRAKFTTAIEAEIQERHATIAKLQSELREREERLRNAKEELAPLTALYDVYRNRALPAPETPVTPSPAPVATSVPTPSPPTKSARVVLADPGAPIEADLATIHAWSVQRGIPCTTWDDLPGVNRKREQLGLPTFKRKFSR